MKNLNELTNREVLNKIIDDLFEELNDLTNTINAAPEYDKQFWCGYQSAIFNTAENLRGLLRRVK